MRETSSVGSPRPSDIRFNLYTVYPGFFRFEGDHLREM